MIYANIFGKIAGVIFYICLGISLALLVYGGVRRLIDIIRTKRKLKKAEKDVLDLDDDKK